MLEVEVEEEQSEPEPELEQDEELLSKVPRGKPKSGRHWKSEKHKFSGLVKVKPLKTSWEKKLKDRRERKITKEHENEMKDNNKKEKEEARQRIVDRKKREEANARRAEIVQPVKNTAKIKRMKRKQLRLIEKR